MGGTYAVSLTAAHPDVFRTFLDIAGDLTPNAGNPRDTLDRLYGGDTTMRDRYDPVTAMRAHGRYEGVAGRFVDGSRAGAADGLSGLTQEEQRVPPGPEPSSVLCPEARRYDIECDVVTTDLPHQWQLAERQFREHLGWLAGRLGLGA